MKRTVRDLLAALTPAGIVEGWVPATIVGPGASVKHRFRLHKTDLIAELKKLPADREARFRILEWTYTRGSNVNQRWRARSVWVGGDGPDSIERRHELEYVRPT